MIRQNALRAATFKGWRNCCHRREMLLVTLVAVCCGTFLNREMWIVNRNCLGCVHGTGMVRCFFSLPPPPTFPSFKPLFFFSFLRKWKMVKIGEKKCKMCIFFQYWMVFFWSPSFLYLYVLVGQKRSFMFFHNIFGQPNKTSLLSLKLDNNGLCREPLNFLSFFYFYRCHISI